MSKTHWQDVKVTFDELAEQLKRFEGQTVIHGGGMALSIVKAVQDERANPQAVVAGQPPQPAPVSCPIGVVLPDGHHLCELTRGHDGDHVFADEGGYADEQPASVSPDLTCVKCGAPR